MKSLNLPRGAEFFVISKNFPQRRFFPSPFPQNIPRNKKNSPNCVGADGYILHLWCKQMALTNTSSRFNSDRLQHLSYPNGIKFEFRRNMS